MRRIGAMMRTDVPEAWACAPLEDVRVHVWIHDALSVVKVRHRYRNREDKPIEAVFTFPVPLDATVLGLEAEIGGARLQARVVEREDAEEAYERAIGQGDAAVLLEEVEPGIHAVNLGNLNPNEEAVLTIRYGIPNRWRDGRLRFVLPTVIAPRYGMPDHEPHHHPDVDPLASHSYALEVEIAGDAAEAEVSCPTHPVRIERGERSVRVRPCSERLTMDRDFVLVLRRQKTRAAGFYLRTPKGVLMMAAFAPQAREGSARATERERAARIKIVCDCSGSMAGDSIWQAKEALRCLLAELSPEDRFTIVRFGSRHEWLFPELRPSDGEALAQALAYLRRMDADMGGTELARALKAAFALDAGVPADVVLITDGEVWRHDRIVALARHSEHRVFVVGVGSAPVEGLLAR
ncbi:MAG: VWA domain-containing protein, partial [Zetaproteobacteria bacterium]